MKTLVVLFWRDVVVFARIGGLVGVVVYTLSYFVT